MACDGEGARVLVVDDNQTMRTVICRMLTGHGYQVDAASTLAEARSMDPSGYGAVIVDAHLGDERGTDLIDALRVEDPATARRCLLITGGLRSALPAGVPHLVKPFQSSELLAVVNRLSHPGAPEHQRETGNGKHEDGADPQGGADAQGGAHQQDGGPQQAPGGKRVSGAGSPWELLKIIRRQRDRESIALADFLHDGPIQQLAAATLALHMLQRSASPGHAESLDGVMRELNSAARAIRWLLDQYWQPAPPPAGQATIQTKQTALLAGEPLTLDIHQADGISLPELGAVVDVAELMLLAAVPAGMSAKAGAEVVTAGHEIEIKLTVDPAADDGEDASPVAARAALKDLAHALGAEAEAEFGSREWRTRLVIPKQPGSRLTEISDIPPKSA